MSLIISAAVVKLMVSPVVSDSAVSDSALRVSYKRRNISETVLHVLQTMRPFKMIDGL